MITLSRNTVLKREAQVSVCHISYVCVWLAPQYAFPIWEVPLTGANKRSVPRFALAAPQCSLFNCNDVLRFLSCFRGVCSLCFVQGCTQNRICRASHSFVVGHTSWWVPCGHKDGRRVRGVLRLDIQVRQAKYLLPQKL